MKSETKNGVQLIAAERERQIAIEGWTPDHDDEHDTGNLAASASAYLLMACEQVYPEQRRSFEAQKVYYRDHAWPLDEDFWKPADPIRNLVKAGALIAAEIDRLLRLSTPR